MTDRLTPGRLLKIGGPEEYDFGTIAPRLTEDRYLSCTVNTGPLNLLAAAVTTAKAEGVPGKRPPLVSQLCAYEFPNHGWRWFYAPSRVAQTLGIIARSTRTARWFTINAGNDGRSPVAQLRWCGVHIVTRPLEPVTLAKGVEAPNTEYELIGRAAVGADAFAMTRQGEAAPLAEILPTPEVCACYRTEQIHRAMDRRVAAAQHDEEWLAAHPRLDTPATPEQPELPF